MKATGARRSAGPRSMTPFKGRRRTGGSPLPLDRPTPAGVPNRALRPATRVTVQRGECGRPSAGAISSSGRESRRVPGRVLLGRSSRRSGFRAERGGEDLRFGGRLGAEGDERETQNQRCARHAASSDRNACKRPVFVAVAGANATTSSLEKASSVCRCDRRSYCVLVDRGGSQGAGLPRIVRGRPIPRA